MYLNKIFNPRLRCLTENLSVLQLIRSSTSMYLESRYIHRTHKYNKEDLLNKDVTKNLPKNKTIDLKTISEGDVFYQMRLSQIQKLKEQGENVYPHSFKITCCIKEFIKKYSSLKNEESAPDDEVVAGRIHSIRRANKKLWFIDIIQDGQKLQIKCTLNNYSDNEEFYKDLDNIQRGDIVGVSGSATRTKTGELSICPTKLQILSPCLSLFPSMHTGIISQEKIYRHRHLDLMVNQMSRQKFILRSKIISHIRRFLENLDFLEVETPIMNTTFGGAIARPFITHHNELDMNLYLRIAPELYLKQLVIGGLERVFEIGKIFRNEGIDGNHSPEFTSCEFYMAYADYNDLLELTETLISNMVLSLFGSYEIKYNEHLIDFTPPFKRIDFLSGIEKSMKTSLPEAHQLHTDKSCEFLSKLLNDHNITCKHPHTPSKLLDKLCEVFLEKQCIQPTFIINHPEIMSPLAKNHRSRKGVAERFEFFIAKHEICNAYTEMNDPVEQRKRFELNENRCNFETNLDENYCTALEFGLPPTAGWGIGIDRLTMILNNATNIKDIILFPLLKPKT